MICCGNYNKRLLKLAFLSVIFQVLKHPVCCNLQSFFRFHKWHNESSILPEMVGFETHSELTRTSASCCDDLWLWHPNKCAFGKANDNACISIEFTGALTTVANVDKLWGMSIFLFITVHILH